MKRNVKWLKSLGVLLGIIGVGLTLSLTPTTFSYLISQDDITNNFSNGAVEIEIEEIFTTPEVWDGSAYQKIVQIKNLGTKHSLIRVAIVPRWENSDGTPFAGDTSLLEIAFANQDAIPGWKAGGDGYYYYTDKVDTNALTNQIVTNVTFLPEIDPLILARYRDKVLIVEVKAEAVVANSEAYQNVWSQMAGSNSSTDLMLEALIATP
ncbi:MAG: hypothetical protein ACRC6H_09105 [Culicoidibacterales bacterium]